MKDQKKDNRKSPFVTNIDEIYKKLSFYKKSLVSAITCGVIQATIIFCLIFSNPIVILDKDGERIAHVGEKRSITIGENEIKELARKFIKNRYEWHEFNPEYILGNLAPFIKSGLRVKIREKLKERKSQFKEKKVSQYVGKIKVHIDDKKRIVGIFDKILRVENIPLISEAQVVIGIVKGYSNKANKIGLYINSVVNYANK